MRSRDTLDKPADDDLLRYFPLSKLFFIGAFTVTSFAVSRGRLESLIGKRFAAGGLRVYFAGIDSLVAFILLTNKIMIMFCIGAEYIEHCSDGWFYFFIIQKRENEENFG